MSYGILKFKLPEEQYEFKTATEAMDTKSAIADFENWLRSQIKHSDMSEDKYNAYIEIRETFCEFLGEPKS
jgi:hypothetical protein